ncbi:RcnB family protein [Sphingomonas oryzagri]
MKTHLLLGSALLLLVAPDIALAQEHGRPGGGGGQHARPPAGKPGPSRPGGSGPSPSRPSPSRPGGPGARPPGAGRPEVKPSPSRPQPSRPGAGHGRPQPSRPGHGTARPPHRPGFRPPNFRPIHRPGWHYPSGYRYRRWTIGLLLPHLFLSSRYYFDDYADYGFGPPPYGYRWVRYGPDLLLADVRTGRIRDVIYGAFY